MKVKTLTAAGHLQDHSVFYPKAVLKPRFWYPISKARDGMMHRHNIASPESRTTLGKYTIIVMLRYPIISITFLQPPDDVADLHDTKT